MWFFIPTVRARETGNGLEVAVLDRDRFFECGHFSCARLPQFLIYIPTISDLNSQSQVPSPEYADYCCELSFVAFEFLCSAIYFISSLLICHRRIYIIAFII